MSVLTLVRVRDSLPLCTLRVGSSTPSSPLSNYRCHGNGRSKRFWHTSYPLLLIPTAISPGFPGKTNTNRCWVHSHTFVCSSRPPQKLSTSRYDKRPIVSLRLLTISGGVDFSSKKLAGSQVGGPCGFVVDVYCDQVFGSLNMRVKKNYHTRFLG